MTDCNVIANNEGAGIALETPPPMQPPPLNQKPVAGRTTIRGNSIYLNKYGGIDRPSYGITPNDVIDTNVDFPIGVTRSVKAGTSITVVSGFVQVPNPQHADLTIDVYRLDPGPDQEMGTASCAQAWGPTGIPTGPSLPGS